ncbi:hypothetical protein BS50DRAFT_602288 [Corynespora cassiicola Philippines]|uniref:SigF-like NTF2-like domain-containing protein n=1 Tax=Corynespora cassiicola Philippines TaxID=1448308 RepID=A0A2T2NH64_CORCC|nr:hypothetical protein BS50DRAFT_602288 [Corynespora cassiicola Philippines]
MENPVKEISGVIHLLTQSPPSQQRETIETYFTPNASFTHPFCRTGSWQNSRFLIHSIYRWYKIMSPRIDITVQSVAFDKPNLLLYVTLHQTFRIWALPLYAAPVSLTTVLTLERHPPDHKYYIAAQNDLYQVDQFVRFVWLGGWLLVRAWQFCATLLCLVGAGVLWPVSLVEEWYGEGEASGGGKRRRRRESGRAKGVVVDGIELRDLDKGGRESSGGR